MRSKYLIPVISVIIALALIIVGAVFVISAVIHGHTKQPFQPWSASEPTPARTAPSIAPVEPSHKTLFGSAVDRAAVATSYEDFYNHFYHESPAQIQQVRDAIERKPLSTARGTTPADVKKVRTELERIDPYFLKIDTRGLADVQAITLYAKTAFLGADSSAEVKIDVRVDPDDVAVEGNTGAIQAAAIKVYINNKDATGAGVLTPADATLNRVAGQWLIKLSD